jgi:hypothetical protein
MSNDGSCSLCKGNENSSMQEMPCCGVKLCWDFCLWQLPLACPVCGQLITVDFKKRLVSIRVTKHKRKVVV